MGNTSRANSSDDDSLVEPIKIFSEDVGERGQTAFAQLRSRRTLTDDLLHLQQKLLLDDSLQPQIAFVFCNLGYKYELNARIIVAALARKPKYQNFDADQAASLLIRLIKRGDKTLLPAVLHSADWADGALAELVGTEAADQLVKNTTDLLVTIKREPPQIRLKLYKLVANTELSLEERKIVNSRLRQIRPKSPLYGVAQEVLGSIVNVK